MSEQEVRERAIPYECGIARFRETSRGHIMGLNAGMMKMLFSIRTRRLLGVQGRRTGGLAARIGGGHRTGAARQAHH